MPARRNDLKHLGEFVGSFSEAGVKVEFNWESATTNRLEMLVEGNQFALLSTNGEAFFFDFADKIEPRRQFNNIDQLNIAVIEKVVLAVEGVGRNKPVA